MTIKGIGLDSPQLMGYRRDKIGDVNVRLDYIEAAAQHPDAACPAGRSAFAGEDDQAVFPDADSFALGFTQRAQVDRSVFQQGELRSVPAIEL